MHSRRKLPLLLLSDSRFASIRHDLVDSQRLYVVAIIIHRTVQISRDSCVHIQHAVHGAQRSPISRRCCVLLLFSRSSIRIENLDVKVIAIDPRNSEASFADRNIFLRAQISETLTRIGSRYVWNIFPHTHSYHMTIEVAVAGCMGMRGDGGVV